MLSALGVPAEQQVAIDHDERALRKFSDQYPRVKAVCADVAVALAQNAVDVAVLDFFGNYSEALEESAVQALLALRDGGSVVVAPGEQARSYAKAQGYGHTMVSTGRSTCAGLQISRLSFIAIAYERARERGAAKRAILDMRQELAPLRARVRDWQRDNDAEDESATLARDLDPRMFLLGQRLRKEGLKIGRSVAPIDLITYSSTHMSNVQSGTPMAIAIFAVSPTSLSLQYFAAADQEFGDHWPSAVTLLRRLHQQAIVTQQTYLEKLDFWASCSGHILRTDPITFLQNRDDLAQFYGAEIANKMLNVTNGEVAALRAHATRGTYAKGPRAKQRSRVKASAAEYVRWANARVVR